MAQTLPDPSPPLAIVPPLRRWAPEWAIPEVPVPESDTHDLAIVWLRELLAAWVARTGRDIKVARNLGIRWVRDEPRFGFDPDLCMIEPAPIGEHGTLGSSRVWRGAHAPPLLAIEVVSAGHPYKDYVDTPERCAACGVGELWVYDPMLVGPSARGGPHLFQLWQRRDDGGFERVFAGSGSTFSPALGAWVHPRASQLASEERVLISNDPDGRDLWLPAEQEARAGEKRARDSERQARASEQAAIASEQAAIASERAAIASERAAIASEREARAAERQALDQLKQERAERVELEKRLRQLEEQARRGRGM